MTALGSEPDTPDRLVIDRNWPGADDQKTKICSFLRAALMK